MFFGVVANGYNVVDVASAKEKGIPVLNIPTYGTDAVSKFFIALLPERCHHIWEHSDCTKRGDWTNNGARCFCNYLLVEFAGKTMMITGFGRIGRRTGEIAQALGTKVLAFGQRLMDIAVENLRSFLEGFR